MDVAAAVLAEAEDIVDDELESVLVEQGVALLSRMDALLGGR